MPRHIVLRRLLQLLASGLALKVIFTTLFEYRNYFPANFRADFLLGREPYFHGLYAAAFYTHIITGPLALALGMLQLSPRMRQRRPEWHRRMGRLLAPIVIAGVAPSGAVMSLHAATGTFSAAGFAILSALTAWCCLHGWRAAVRRNFPCHQRWMLRTFALLSSAVVIRVIGGAAEVLGVEGTYPYAAWLSWLGPLACVELWSTILRSLQHRRADVGQVAIE